MRLSRLIFVFLLATFGNAAIAQDLDAARTFVTGIYKSYKTNSDPGPGSLGKNAAKVFAPHLRALIRKDQVQAGGEVGALDYDPLCNCQDYAISKLQISVDGQGADQVHAAVRFVNSGEPQKIDLDLVLVGKQWRISDVHVKDTPSLVKYLEQATQEAAKH